MTLDILNSNNFNVLKNLCTYTFYQNSSLYLISCIYQERKNFRYLDVLEGNCLQITLFLYESRCSKETKQELLIDL